MLKTTYQVLEDFSHLKHTISVELKNQEGLRGWSQWQIFWVEGTQRKEKRKSNPWKLSWKSKKGDLKTWVDQSRIDLTVLQFLANSRVATISPEVARRFSVREVCNQHYPASLSYLPDKWWTWFTRCIAIGKNSCKSSKKPPLPSLWEISLVAPKFKCSLPTLGTKLA